MKRTLLVIICVFATTSLFAQKTNFSGTWQLDTAKTKFGQAPHNIIPVTVKVEQQADRLILTRIGLDNSMNPQLPVTETLLFDGSPLQRKVGDAAITTTLRWPGNDGFTLTRNGGVTATEDWSLTDNGQTLVIDREVEQHNGLKYTNRGYYNKQ